MSAHLLLCWVIVVAAVLAGALVRPRSPWRRLAASLAWMLVFTAVLLPVIHSTLQPDFTPGATPMGLLPEKLLVAAWWVLLARTLIVAGQVALRIHQREHAARLASDLVSGVIYLGAALAVLELAFGVSVTGLVATSGIIAIVLGLALQSTLADLFSGIALGIDKPFLPGDAVWIEGAIEGRVVETSWRSTRILTAANDVATVPNSVIAKARILNRSSPDELNTHSVKVILDPGFLPSDGVALLSAAALNAGAVSRDGQADVSCTDVTSAGAVYDIFFAATLASFGRIRSALLNQVVRHARHAGVALANRDGRPFTPAVRIDTAGLIDRNPILKHLGSDERAALVVRAVSHVGEEGTSIHRQGEITPSLFIIATGTLEAVRDEEGATRRLGLLGPGDWFGELSLLTGAQNGATVAALTPFAAIEITKDSLSPLLASNPSLVHALEKGAAETRAILAAGMGHTDLHPSPAGGGRLYDRIRAFMGLADEPGPPA